MKKGASGVGLRGRFLGRVELDEFNCAIFLKPGKFFVGKVWDLINFIK